MDDLFQWVEQHPCTASAAPPQPVCIAPADPLQTPPDLPAEFAAIWKILEQHRGAASAITAPQIAAAAGLWPDMSPANAGTKVRKILEQTQDWWPWPVCGDSEGFYLAVTAEEMAHYSANLRGRFGSIIKRFVSHRRAGVRVGFTYLGKGRWSGTPKGVMPIAK